MTRTLALLLVLAPASADAYTFICTDQTECLERGRAVHWDVSSMPVPYSAGPGPSEFDLETTAQVVQDVFTQWSDVPCASISLVYDGAVDFVQNEVDGTNLVAWCENGCLGGGGALGVAVPVYDGQGGIIDCDEFMDNLYDWTSDPADEAAGYSLAQAVVAQESGHCLGMGHSGVDGATMYPLYQPGAGFETLDPDDVDGICMLYPLEDGCSDDGDCREGTCVGGQCVIVPEGPRELGQPCEVPEDCLSALCVSVADGPAVCGQDCDETQPAEGCPDGFVCRQLDACDEGACVAGSLGSIEAGAPCAEDDECVTGRCAQLPQGRVCAVPCDPDDDACGDDATCFDVPGTCGACRSDDAPRGIGEPCDEPADCASGLCDGPAGGLRCTQGCEDDGGCGDGTVCEGGLCRVADDATLCAPCEDDEDCASGLCASAQDAGYCSRACEDDADCPAHFTCADQDGTRACAPEGACFAQPCEDVECIEGYLCGKVHGERSCTRVCDDANPCPHDWECVPGDEAETTYVCIREDDGGGGSREGCGCRTAGDATAPILLSIALGLLLLRRRR